MNKKLIIMISSASIAAIAILVGIFCLLRGKKDSYRIIKIFEWNGSATVTREGTGDITPYNNMMLESGDDVFLESGNMTIKMDEDKYAYVEEDTRFSIKAEGKAENSKTTIDVTSGAITNEIQNKLNDESSYEINTPNSTMAVRGTVFRTEVYYDDNGICYTKVSVFEGKVVTRLVYPDGTVSEEETTLEAGKEVIIYRNEQVTDYLSKASDIDYSTLPEEVQKLIQNVLGDLSTDKENDTEQETTEKETTQESTTEAFTEGNTTEITTKETTEEKTTEKKTTEKKTTEEKTTEETGVYTVTFMYNGTVFGTQMVKKGECATVPSLMPASNGDWDFDFSTPITKDTVIYWK